LCVTRHNRHQPAAHFKWHKGAITSIEWHPTEESVLAVSGDDNQVTTWDMSLEADAESAAEGGELDDASSIPPQLLFVHMVPRPHFPCSSPAPHTHTHTHTHDTTHTHGTHKLIMFSLLLAMTTIINNNRVSRRSRRSTGTRRFRAPS